jgi:hypothetical protein
LETGIVRIALHPKEIIMSFLQDSERLIFMDLHTGDDLKVRLPAEDIKKMVDAGVKTAMVFYTRWDWIEPQKNVYDWGFYDDRVKLLTDNGMKVLLQSCTTFPTWIPDDWKIKNAKGQLIGIPSPWNKEAFDYVRQYYKIIRDRYNSDKVLVVNSFLSDGETVFPNELCIYDDSALKAFKDKFGGNPEDMVEQRYFFLKDTLIEMYYQLQKEMSNNQFDEIWCMLHPALAGYHGNGCEWISEILQTIRTRIPYVNMNHLYCTWVQWRMFWPIMNEWSKIYGESIFGGAEWAEGLPTSVPMAMQNSIRGLLVGPCHPFTGHKRIEPWMLDNMKNALKTWDTI